MPKIQYTLVRLALLISLKYTQNINFFKKQTQLFIATGKAQVSYLSRRILYKEVLLVIVIFYLHWQLLLKSILNSFTGSLFLRKILHIYSESDYLLMGYGRLLLLMVHYQLIISVGFVELNLIIMKFGYYYWRKPGLNNLDLMIKSMVESIKKALLR